MEEQILELRSQGKTYKQIIEIVGCSKSTVSYYCNTKGKESVRNRTKKLRESNKLLKKVDFFKSSFKERLHYKRNMFLKEECIPKGSFSYKDILKKFGEETTCYLTGEKINLLSSEDYNLDHIIPRSRGGSNELDNLGITLGIVNQMKHALLVPELLYWCEKILIHHGYNITKD